MLTPDLSARCGRGLG